MNPIYPLKLICFATVVLLQLGLAACGDATGVNNGVSSNALATTPIIPTFHSPDANNPGNTPAAMPVTGTLPVSSSASSGNGRFNLSFGLSMSLAGTTSAVSATRATQIERQLTPSMLAVNDLVGLPDGNVPIIVSQCGLANAFYVSSVPEIVLCTELLDAAYQALLRLFDQDIARASRVAGQVFTFFMLHEIAHALDHQLDLPVFGNTESAADAIATVLAAETGTPDIVLFSAYLFTLSGDGTFGDVHHAGEDRAGDLVCWVLGSDPALMAAEGLNELGQQFVDAGRDCVGEYAEQRTAVERWIPRLGDLDASQQLTQLNSAKSESDAHQDMNTILNQLNLLL